MIRSAVFNVKIERHGYAMISLSFETADARYHLFLDPETLLPRENEDPSRRGGGKVTLYKNSRAKHNEPGHFATRHLSADSATWKPTIDAIYSVLDLDAERARLAAEENAAMVVKATKLSAGKLKAARVACVDEMFAALETAEELLAASIEGRRRSAQMVGREEEEALAALRDALRAVARAAR